MVPTPARSDQTLGEASDIAMGGGFFKAGAMLTDMMRAYIRAEIPNMQFGYVTDPPVVGAILLAMRRDGVSDGDIATARGRLLAHPSAHTVQWGI